MEGFIERLFLSVFNMSITATVVIAGVLVLRPFLKKAPKAVSFGFWFVVLFRLLCPYSFESAVSLFGLFGSAGSMEHIPADIGTMIRPKINMVIPATTDTFNASLPAATPAASVNPLQVILFLMALVWVLGVMALLIYSGLSYLLLKRRISTATLIQDNIYQTDQISSPFVLGFIRPKIVLPISIGKAKKDYIIRHEQNHIRRRDYLVKPLWFLAVIFHWFNPLVWVSFFLMSRDMEMSCDEGVIRGMGEDIKTDYSTSLLALSVPRRLFCGSPLAFGETSTMSRVKNVLSFKPPVFWAVVAAAVVVIAASVVLATNPKTEGTDTVLTLQLVQELSQKGDSLTWEDFTPFRGTEVGSGLYIMRYVIDDEYSILMGGGSAKGKPFYINLISRYRDKSIDIRKENVSEFLSKNNMALRPMIKLNDRLYALSTVMVDLDPSRLIKIGQVESVVGSALIPTQNNQANHEVQGAVIYDSGENIIVNQNGDYILYEKM